MAASACPSFDAMRIPFDVVQRETSLCLSSCRDMKRQISTRPRRLSGFQAIAEMLMALLILYEAFLPIALLWWNAILCACCARYRSWNKSRSRVEWPGHQAFDEAARRRSDAKEIERGLVPRHRRRDSSKAGTKDFTDNHTILHAHTSFGQAMEFGCLAEQLEISLQAPENDDMYGDDDVFEMGAGVDIEKQSDTKESDSNSAVGFTSSANCSKHTQWTLQSDKNKLFNLHLFNASISRQSGFLKTAHLANCCCLTRADVAPLAMFDLVGSPEKLIECICVRLEFFPNINFMDGKVPMQLLQGTCFGSPALEKYLLVSLIVFISSLLSRFDSKERIYLTRQIFRDLMSKHGFVGEIILQLDWSFSLNDLDLTTKALLLKTLKGSIDSVSCDLGKHPSSAHVLDLQAKNYACQTCDKAGSNVVIEEKDVVNNGSSMRKILSESCDENSCNGISDFNSDDNLIQNQNPRNAGQCRQMLGGKSISTFTSRSNCDDEFSDRGEEVKFSGEILKLENNFCLYSDESTDEDTSNDHPQWLEEEDGACAGYYKTPGGFVSNDTYFQSSWKSDDVGFDGPNHDNGHGVDANSRQVMELDLLVDTWWDEGAVLVGTPKQDECIMDQTWQMI